MAGSGLLNLNTVMVVPGEYISRYAYDGNNQLEYEGYAPTGTATSDDKWTVRKYAYSSGILQSILIAKEVDWDSRTGHDYE